MPTFEVITQSTFENVYLIEAESKEEAVGMVLDSNNAPDFYQKHLGEGMRDVNIVSDPQAWPDTIRSKGYF